MKYLVVGMYLWMQRLPQQWRKKAYGNFQLLTKHHKLTRFIEISAVYFVGPLSKYTNRTMGCCLRLAINV